MRLSLPAAAAILLCAGTPGFAHRLDEYLQATLLSVESSHMEVQVRLAPGVAVVPNVLALIDTDADGSISGAEQSAYAKKVLGDLSVTMNGDPLHLRLTSARFATPEAMREGLGEIQLDFRADLPRGGPNRRLVFQNRHLSRFAAYLVNVLVPGDPDVHLSAQNRNDDQSVYQLDYVQSDGRPMPWLSGWWSGERTLTAAALLLLLGRLVWLRGANARTYSPHRGQSENAAVPPCAVR